MPDFRDLGKTNSCLPRSMNSGKVINVRKSMPSGVMVILVINIIVVVTSTQKNTHNIL